MCVHVVTFNVKFDLIEDLHCKLSLYATRLSANKAV